MDAHTFAPSAAVAAESAFVSVHGEIRYLATRDCKRRSL